MRFKLVALIVAAFGAVVAHGAQRAVDPGRQQIAEEISLLVMPSGQAFRIASMGFHVHVADLTWVRAVLGFGERIDKGDMGDDAEWSQWFARTILAVSELDPTWRTPYFHGSSMLRVAGAPELSTELLLKGHQARPDDYYMPFSIGMNHYMHGDDKEEAARWLEKAAGLPGAPDWYSTAAVAMRQERHSGRQAIEFLRQELERAEDPKLRERIEERIAKLWHEELSETLTEGSERFEERFGRMPSSAEELLQSGALPFERLPDDPLGAEWTIDVDGAVISTTERQARADRALKIERSWVRLAGTE